MKMSTVALRAAMAAIAVMLVSVAYAQPVLRGGSITEQNLIEALTPVPDDLLLRNIKVKRDPAMTKSGEKAARASEIKKASASLLITFETNSDQLTPAAQSSLDVVARALQDERLAAFKFSIEGHADPRGQADYNLRLSQARAESVVGYLTSRHGIGLGRLQPIGKGDTELANPARPAAPENRRVTITTLQ